MASEGGHLRIKDRHLDVLITNSCFCQDDVLTLSISHIDPNPVSSTYIHNICRLTHSSTSPVLPQKTNPWRRPRTCSHAAISAAKRSAAKRSWLPDAQSLFNLVARASRDTRSNNIKLPASEKDPSGQWPSRCPRVGYLIPSLPPPPQGQGQGQGLQLQGGAGDHQGGEGGGGGCRRSPREVYFKNRQQNNVIGGRQTDRQTQAAASLALSFT